MVFRFCWRIPEEVCGICIPPSNPNKKKREKKQEIRGVPLCCILHVSPPKECPEMC